MYNNIRRVNAVKHFTKPEVSEGIQSLSLHDGRHESLIQFKRIIRNSISDPWSKIFERAFDYVRNVARTQIFMALQIQFKEIKKCHAKR